MFLGAKSLCLRHILLETRKFYAREEYTAQQMLRCVGTHWVCCYRFEPLKNIFRVIFGHVFKCWHHEASFGSVCDPIFNVIIEIALGLPVRINRNGLNEIPSKVSSDFL